MFEFITIVVFLWLLLKAAKLAWKLTWGAAKIIASILMVFALPLLILFFIFAGGLVLLIPIAMLAAALFILKILV